MIEQQLIDALTKSAAQWCGEHDCATTCDDISLIPPPHYFDFDYVCALSMKLSARSKADPLLTAEALASLTASNMPANFADVKVTAPGFINFTLTTGTYVNALRSVITLVKSWDAKRSGLHPSAPPCSDVERRLRLILSAAAEPLFDVENRTELEPLITPDWQHSQNLGEADSASWQLLFDNATGAGELKTTIKALCAAAFAMQENRQDTPARAYVLRYSVEELLNASSIVSPTRGITLARLSLFSAVATVLAVAHTKTFSNEGVYL